MISAIVRFAKDIGRDILKKAFLGIALAVATPILIWAVSGLPGAVINGQFSPSGAIQGLWLFISTNADAAIQLAANYPFRSIGIAAATVVFLILIWLFFQFGKRLSEMLNRLQHGLGLLSRVGLYGFFPFEGTTDSKARWKSLVDAAAAPENRIVQILGATGWDTFGATSSPLHDSICNFTGMIEIILLDPNSRHIATRAASVNMSVKTYKSQIVKSIRCIREWHRKGKKIELRLYDSPPNWKLIFTATSLWLQHYRPGQHVEQTPCYAFYPTDDGQGLYHLFADDFRRIWMRTTPVDLATIGQTSKKQAKAG